LYLRITGHVNKNKAEKIIHFNQTTHIQKSDVRLTNIAGTISIFGKNVSETKPCLALANASNRQAVKEFIGVPLT
jgi:hypothetical protein